MPSLRIPPTAYACRARDWRHQSPEIWKKQLSEVEEEAGGEGERKGNTD
jgi:hypothetical protein